ncbi:MAG: SurA N-terminal domain-containing protein [Chitinophagales bacterium]
MAVFQIIRGKLGGIVVGIIILSLALFVFETAFNSNTSLLQKDKDIVGVIDGNKIHYRDFDARVEEAKKNYMLQTNQTNLDENTLFSIREQAWNQIVNEQLNGSEYNKLGLTISNEELKDMFFGKDPVPEIKQAFTNPQTGTFDPLAVRNYYQHLDEQGQNEQPGERRVRWVNFENAQKDQRIAAKYADMIKNALYIPKWQAEQDYNEKNTRAAVNFVSVPYSTVSDSSIKVTDSELENYIRQHATQFRQEESRALDYVIFPVFPSADDTADVQKSINDINSRLLAAPNDTDLVKLNSDKGLDKFYYKKDNISSAFVKDTLFKVPAGSVIGPYYENGNYKIAKLMERREIADSVKAHHILVRVEPGTDTTAAYKKIDSIYQVIQSGEPFDSLAKNFSEDEGSGAIGGDLGWVRQGITVPSFNHYLFFEGNQGEMKIVRSDFGYHLIRIDSLQNVTTGVQVNFISRPLEASSETDKAAFDKATRFASENNTVEKFEKAATDQKLNKMSAPSVLKNANQLPGLPSARDIVKWSYTAKLNEVSSPFPIENNYVVAVVTGIKKEGTATAEDVRQQVELLVRKQKKGQQIASQITADMSLNTTLDALAAKLNQPVKTAANVVFANAFAENLGFEPKVVGTVFTLKEKSISQPVIGEQGVYVVQVQSFTKPQPIADYNQFRQQLLTSLAPRLQYGLPETLKKAVKIEDDRYLFF